MVVVSGRGRQKTKGKENHRENGDRDKQLHGAEEARVLPSFRPQSQEVGAPSIRGPGVTASPFRSPFLPWAARAISATCSHGLAVSATCPTSHHSWAAHEVRKLPSEFLEEQ